MIIYYSQTAANGKDFHGFVWTTAENNQAKSNTYGLLCTRMDHPNRLRIFQVARSTRRARHKLWSKINILASTITRRCCRFLGYCSQTTKSNLGNTVKSMLPLARINNINLPLSPA